MCLILCLLKTGYTVTYATSLSLGIVVTFLVLFNVLDLDSGLEFNMKEL